MMQQKTFEFVLKAQQPIAHSAGNEGNHSYLMTRGQIQPDGSIVDVPIVTADTMRHGLREAMAMAFLDAAGLVEGPTLSKAALRLLFNGGMVTGRGDASIVKLDLYREMVSLIPGLGLLGGCANNRVIQGYTWVDDALLICEETMHLMPEKVHTWLTNQKQQINEFTAHVEVVQRVRMDAVLDPAKVRLLSAGAQAEVTHALLASENAHNSDDAIGRAENKSSMLPRTYERIKAGSLFYWSVTGTLYSELELDTFVTMIASFLYNARIGGKKSTGCGLLRPIQGAAWDVTLAPTAERSSLLDTKELAPGVGRIFRKHVEANKNQVRKFLSEVDA